MPTSPIRSRARCALLCLAALLAPAAALADDEWSPPEQAAAAPAPPTRAPAVPAADAGAVAAPIERGAGAGAADGQPARVEGPLLTAPGDDRRPYVDPALPEPTIDVWERIRRGFAIPDLETKLAANRTQWYVNQPDYLDRMANRASLYLFHIVEEIEKRGMPTELALLPFVESAMQPEAISHAQAAGLWQFIPSTGRLYSLEQNLWRDERRDIIASTRAALDYLQKLYGDFGDWHLALAAYNWGEGAVSRAIARNRAQRKPAVYTALRMPRETQYYVPKLQAIKNIVRAPERYGVTLPAVRNEPYFVALSKSRDIDVTTAAQLAEMPLDEFRALNPAFNRPLIVGAAQPQILLPAERAETFLANLAAFESTGQPLASWTTYTLARNETLAQVAQRAGVSESHLREANSIPPRYRLAPGSTILVPRDESMDDDVAAKYLEASFSLVPENASLRRITVRVRRGDTLYSVARRWKVDPQEIVAWNRLRSQSLFAGQRLTLTVARGPARPVATRARSTAPARAALRPTARRAATTGRQAQASRKAAGSAAVQAAVRR